MTVPTPRTARQRAASVEERLTLLERAMLGKGGSGGTADSVAWANVTGKPSTFPPSAHTHGLADVEIVSLGTGVDLNSLTSTKRYHQPANANAAAGSNYPVAYAGLLDVYAASSMVYQRYTTYNGSGSYERERYQTTWSAWRHVTNTWQSLVDKPTSFPSSWAEVTGKPSTFPSTWATVSGKPSTFTPSAHTHASSQITDFASAADARVNALVPPATTSAAGKVELATDAETQAGTLSSRAVTPASLTARTATESRTGLARLATLSEALLTPTSVDPSADLDDTIMTPQRVMDMLEAYVPAAGFTGTSLRIQDWNLATRVGFYSSSPSAQNGPSASNYVVGLVHNGGYGSHSAGGFGTIVQEVMEITDDPSVLRTFRRSGLDGTWTAWEEIDGPPTWGDITGKPSTFPSTWATVSGKPTTFPPASHSHAWSEVTGKPTTFPAAAHTHAGADVAEATETSRGTVERATWFETLLGTNGTKYVSPIAMKQAVDSAISSALRAAIPPGVVQMAATAAAPSGWLLCDGAAVSRTTYADLYAAIGTTYGAGNGSSTFNLPNLSGRVPVGRDAGQSEFDVLGETGGAKTHTLTREQLASHDHAVRSLNNEAEAVRLTDGTFSLGSSGSYQLAIGTSGGAADRVTATPSGGGEPHNNLQPYTVLNYIIKT